MNLPSLLAFQPQFYRSGPIRHHLALLYDLVATLRPRRLVVAGFANGEAFFTLCQAVRETGLECECIALWRGAPENQSKADQSWLEGKSYAVEMYGEFTRLSLDDSTSAAAQFAERKIDLLLIDDCDSGAEISAELHAWNAALSSDAIVLVHGIELKRADAPKTAWRQWNGERAAAALSAGIGLGFSWSPHHPAAGRSPLKELSDSSDLPSFMLWLRRGSKRRRRVRKRDATQPP